MLCKPLPWHLLTQEGIKCESRPHPHIVSQAESGFSGTQTCSVFQPRTFFYHETFCLASEFKPVKLTTFPLSTSSLFGSFLLFRCFDRLCTALYQPRHRQQSQDDGYGGGVCNHDSLLLQADSLRHSEPRVFGGKTEDPDDEITC